MNIQNEDFSVELKTIALKYLMLKPLTFDEVIILFNGFVDLRNNYNGEKIWRVISRNVNNNPDSENGWFYRKFNFKQFSGDDNFSQIYTYKIATRDITPDEIDDYHQGMLEFIGDSYIDETSSNLVYKHIESGRYLMITGHEYTPYSCYEYNNSLWCECEPKLFTETRYYYK